MSILQIVGTLFAVYALNSYVRLWIALITSREHSPSLNQVLILKIMLAGCVGANMLVWHLIAWWMMFGVNAGVALAVAIPALIFRAR